jgi:hypothetical protein
VSLQTTLISGAQINIPDMPSRSNLKENQQFQKGRQILEPRQYFIKINATNSYLK